MWEPIWSSAFWAFVNGGGAWPMLVIATAVALFLVMAHGFNGFDPAPPRSRLLSFGFVALAFAVSPFVSGLKWLIAVPLLAIARVVWAFLPGVKEMIENAQCFFLAGLHDLDEVPHSKDQLGRELAERREKEASLRSISKAERVIGADDSSISRAEDRAPAGWKLS